MNWIQSFLQRFIKDNEDDESFGVNIHSDKKVASHSYTLNENGKDLNTKISYQYPKAKLSYPVNSQVSLGEKEKRNRKKRVESQTEKSNLSIMEGETVKKEQPKKRLENVPKRTGPFQLTEIPSPVFGFKRPQSQENNSVIEHELSHFLVEDFKEQLVSDVPIIENEPSDLEVTFSSDHMDEATLLTSVNAIQEKKVTLVAEPEPTTLEIEIATKEHYEDTVEEQPEVPKAKPSHIPFNVMMLKQDKLKWEESKRKRKLEQKEPVLLDKLADILSENNDFQLEQVEEMVPIEKVQIENTVKFVQTENVQGEISKKHPQQENMPYEIVTEPTRKSEEPKEEPISHDSVSYEFPGPSLLAQPVLVEMDTEWISYQEELLNQTLTNFNVGAKVVNVTQGPAVTRFEVQPEPGVKVNKITNLSDDIKLSLAARDIRIEAPIPGKHTIGIEVPNQKSRPVLINEIIQSTVFRDSTSPLTAILGLDISGKPIVTELNKMPHGLIAGATGSGKSVCINTILVSLLYKASPEDLKLLLIDPKMVELAPYNRIPHLVSPVITDVKAATAALKWAVEEMERRYELFAHTGVRNISGFNELAMKHKRYSDKLPYMVIVIDELADLMMMSPADVEEAICRIAQKARACGIHLIVATQRPSVDVITGLIKANIPTRIAFSVSSQVDSRTIIDIAGAEKLLGRGDMLFLENGSSKPVRLQGTFVSDEEIDLVVAHVREQQEPQYLFEQEELLKKSQVTEDEDELFYEACEFIIEQGHASTSSLQRRFKIGYNRAARLMDILETNGFITSANGSKPRDVLVTEADLESIQ
ncbi:DNA translocase FtsK [Neobacillus sp. FSL H8-0543]|uniref:DNA translocase FtsK n=2 Tax=Neobacillus sp. FSL H8-0543 TaxID=2954672 RepID=UPI0031584A66